MQSHGQMDAAICARIVDRVADTCASTAQQHAPQAAPSTAAPDFNALAVSIGAQSNALSAQSNLISWLTLAFAGFALLGGIAWALYVRWRATQIARETAQQTAQTWLTEHSAELVEQVVALVTPTGSAGMTPDEQAEVLGDEKSS